MSCVTGIEIKITLCFVHAFDTANVSKVSLNWKCNCLLGHTKIEYPDNENVI